MNTNGDYSTYQPQLKLHLPPVN